MGFKYQQLQQQLQQHIDQGFWQVGDKLPSIRQLCQQFSCSVVTVQHALQHLEAHGLLKALDRSGYYVQAAVRHAEPHAAHALQAAPIKPTDVTLPALFYDLMQRSAAFDFYPSGPIVALPQLALLQRLQSRMQRQHGYRAALCYDEPQGALALRQQVAVHYQALGVALSAEQWCITAGCQQALCLALQATCSPGDVVAVEQPGFYGVLQLLEHLQLRALAIPMTAEGLDVEALSQALRHCRIAACVVTPAYATPTGACMSLAHKRQLLALAQSHDFAVIEDDIYGDLGFTTRPQPLKTLDQADRVVLCGSFSKALSRDVRVGWIAAGRYHAKVQKLKLVTQLAGSQCTELALAQFMAEGHYRRHLQQFRQRLAHQHQQLQQQLQRCFRGIDFSVSHATGGLAVWLQLPEGCDTLLLYQQLLDRKLVLTPGVLFSHHPSAVRCVRLSFTNPVVGSRADALSVLAEAVRQQLHCADQSLF